MRNMDKFFAGLVLSVLMSVSAAFAQDDVDPEPKKEVAEATSMIVVAGAPGTQQYGEQFFEWTIEWEEVAKRSGANYTGIGTSEDASVSSRKQLIKAISSVSPQAATPLWLVLIGHGTFADGVAKFNLTGPDVSAKELAEWLAPIKRPVVVVNCSSSSGSFVNQLSGPRRIVVTATKSGTEESFAYFGKFFAKAIASPESDLDHDDEVSVQEAFLRASAEVKRFYESEGRIATEHAILDDNGDGKGTPSKMFRGTRAIAVAKNAEKLDGAVAARVTLSPAGKGLPFTSEELSRREEIETTLERLRLKKSTVTETQYHQEIEPLMIELAKIYRDAERRAKKGGLP